ncbi:MULTISPECIES: SpaA isopeptide-forming pilin-related protein [unclassified Breznakia]|uniref:SpaA isopeptide-forming pilin-related protein n=1 Tax=unclassified Breznakia TaxID=2623764 RepID=UPI002473E7B2|nr:MULTISPECIES: SpaA isopeptide-forming pilin-related protein [unclassified Breznakia]MDH6365966.1 putative repeat protein (TIGR02543 family) [Breznakia sp. PH1-1]MDH6403102.1 putative repeat protein (TIGR02543 family) [Breznakia sp. PF1-11]MDH6410811.1 putative repeat protein (TIGR02543 family) [Breznakia sp. PFB1-11]MDH6413132.1 putative repeat protein (TIGR02543 family) [Breznakia sp. PFB1-14]MDH6415500.1 putative repeat protein (TIGR02543 family) [Breznakia sp. PFB1-4]
MRKKKRISSIFGFLLIAAMIFSNSAPTLAKDVLNKKSMETVAIASETPTTLDAPVINPDNGTFNVKPEDPNNGKYNVTIPLKYYYKPDSSQMPLSQDDLDKALARSGTIANDRVFKVRLYDQSQSLAYEVYTNTGRASFTDIAEGTYSVKVYAESWVTPGEEQALSFGGTVFEATAENPQSQMKINGSTCVPGKWFERDGNVIIEGALKHTHVRYYGVLYDRNEQVIPNATIDVNYLLSDNGINPVDSKNIRMDDDPWGRYFSGTEDKPEYASYRHIQISTDSNGEFLIDTQMTHLTHYQLEPFGEKYARYAIEVLPEKGEFDGYSTSKAEELLLIQSNSKDKTLDAVVGNDDSRRGKYGMSDGSTIIVGAYSPGTSAYGTLHSFDGTYGGSESERNIFKWDDPYDITYDISLTSKTAIEDSQFDESYVYKTNYYEKENNFPSDSMRRNDKGMLGGGEWETTLGTRSSGGFQSQITESGVDLDFIGYQVVQLRRDSNGNKVEKIVDTKITNNWNDIKISPDTYGDYSTHTSYVIRLIYYAPIVTGTFENYFMWMDNFNDMAKAGEKIENHDTYKNVKDISSVLGTKTDSDLKWNIINTSDTVHGNYFRIEASNTDGSLMTPVKIEITDSNGITESEYEYSFDNMESYGSLNEIILTGVNGLFNGKEVADNYKIKAYYHRDKDRDGLPDIDINEEHYLLTDNSKIDNPNLVSDTTPLSVDQKYDEQWNLVSVNKTLTTVDLGNRGVNSKRNTGQFDLNARVQGWIGEDVSSRFSVKLVGYYDNEGNYKRVNNSKNGSDELKVLDEIRAENQQNTFKLVYAKTYRVTYDSPNEVDGQQVIGTLPLSASYYEGEQVVVKGNVGWSEDGLYPLSVPNHSFDGWSSTDVNNGGAKTDHDANSTFVMPAKNVTLTAKWTKNASYTVTYKPGEAGQSSIKGNVPVDNGTYDGTESIIVKSNDGNNGLGDSLTADDYEFIGWKIEGDTSGKIYEPGESIDLNGGSIVLVGEWRLNTSVTILKKDGTNGINTKMSGVTFELTKKNDNKFVTQTKDTDLTDGKVNFDNLGEGTYVLRETKTKEGYQLPYGHWEINVTDNGGTTAVTISFTGIANDNGGMPPAVIANQDKTYTIYNYETYDLPSTGSNITPIMIMLLGVGAIGLAYVLKRKMIKG